MISAVKASRERCSQNLKTWRSKDSLRNIPFFSPVIYVKRAIESPVIINAQIVRDV